MMSFTSLLARALRPMPCADWPAGGGCQAANLTWFRADSGARLNPPLALPKRPKSKKSRTRNGRTRHASRHATTPRLVASTLMPQRGGAKVATERLQLQAPPSRVEAAAGALGEPPCCSVQSWWFVLGLPAVVLVLGATVVTTVAVSWVDSQRQQVGQRFAVRAASASQVTRSTLARIVDRVDDSVHAIEVSSCAATWPATGIL